jgi:hypothetical protein
VTAVSLVYQKPTIWPAGSVGDEPGKTTATSVLLAVTKDSIPGDEPGKTDVSVVHHKPMSQAVWTNSSSQYFVPRKVDHISMELIIMSIIQQIGTVHNSNIAAVCVVQHKVIHQIGTVHNSKIPAVCVVQHKVIQQDETNNNNAEPWLQSPGKQHICKVSNNNY